MVRTEQKAHMEKTVRTELKAPRVTRVHKVQRVTPGPLEPMVWTVHKCHMELTVRTARTVHKGQRVTRVYKAPRATPGPPEPTARTDHKAHLKKTGRTVRTEGKSPRLTPAMTLRTVRTERKSHRAPKAKMEGRRRGWNSKGDPSRPTTLAYGTTDTVTIGGNNFKSGDFIPISQAVFDLGSFVARWRHVHTSGLRVYCEEIVAALGMNATGSRVTNVAAPIANADTAT
jgi:hypothetical protein